MTRLFTYAYFLLAIALFEAILGLSLQSIGSLIAYNFLLAIAGAMLSVACVKESSSILRELGVLILALTILKVALLFYDLPVTIDAIVDTLLIVAMLLLPLTIKPGKIAYVTILFALTGSLLVILKLDPYTLIGGLFLEVSASILAASNVRNIHNAPRYPG